jgi:hypothetical protein
MRNEATRYLMSFTVLLLLTLNLVVACAQPTPNPVPPTLPKPPPTQPPVVTENQTPQEAPPTNEARDETKWYRVESFSGEGDETTPTFHIYGTEWRISWTIDAEYPETAMFKLDIYHKDAPYIVWQTVSNSGDGSGEVNYFLSPDDKRDFFIKIIAKDLRRWNIILEDNATMATSYPIKITYINYRGTVYPSDPANGICYKRVEPDEYVVIKNLSECYQDMSGWTLKNISKQPSPTFKFPESMMVPGGIIRVYTDEYHLETGGLCFYYGLGDIWSNDKPDIAVLYDAQGNEVSRKSYAVPTKINETGSE